MLGIVLWLGLVGSLVFLSYSAIVHPDRPLPGWSLSDSPPPERMRVWGFALLGCAVGSAAFLPSVVAAASETGGGSPISAGGAIAALAASLLVILFRRPLARRQARRDRFFWGLQEDEAVIARLFTVFGITGASVSALVLVLVLVTL